MKKRIIKIIILLLILTGCKNQKQETKKVTKEPMNNIIEPTIEEPSIDLGIYQNIEGTRKLVEKLEIPFPKLQDMISLEIYYAKEQELIKGTQKNIWTNYKDKQENIEENRIGFHINFKTKNEEFDKTILKPQDVESIFNYIQIYLYDDIHQINSWYSHVTTEEFNDETIFTSIKLTGSIYIDEVVSPITLSVFSYKKDEIEKENKYIGRNEYKIEINRK